MIPLCVEHGIEFQAFSPLAGGWLTGKYTRDARVSRGLADDAATRTRTRRSCATEVFDALEELARLGDPAALSLAWILANPRRRRGRRRPAAARAPRAGLGGARAGGRARRADRVVHVRAAERPRLRAARARAPRRQRVGVLPRRRRRRGDAPREPRRFARWKLRPRVLVGRHRDRHDDDGARHAGRGADRRRAGRACRSSRIRKARRRPRARPLRRGTIMVLSSSGDDASRARSPRPRRARRGGSRCTSSATAASRRR